jgi:uncharacterized membrane protein YidH (DUF202 family)
MPSTARDPEEFDPGLARERTRLAWTRTAFAFAALGAAILKTRVVAGVVVIALGAVVWAIHRVSHYSDPGSQRTRLAIITATVVAAAVVALVIAFVPGGVPLRR